MEEKIKSIMAQMHNIFHDAVGPRSRSDYMKSQGVSGRDWHFGLSAEDIIKDKIPANVIGCTGRAKLFCYLGFCVLRYAKDRVLRYRFYV